MKINDQDIASREQSITGYPPRIEPLGPEEVTAEQKGKIAALWEVLGIPPKEHIPEFFATMLHHPGLMLGQTEYAIQLLRSELSPRHRQLAILRMAWLCQAPYEWSQHLKVGKSQAGLTSDDIKRVMEGASDESWEFEDQTIVQAVEELYDIAMIKDETWEKLTIFLNKKQLLELPLLVGYYQSVAYLQNSVRFRLMPGSKGLFAR